MSEHHDIIEIVKEEWHRLHSDFVTKQDLQHALHKIMIAQATLDASVKGLTAAVDNAVAALATGSTSTSTPDSAVAAYQASVDEQTVRLATATPPPATTPVVVA